MITTITPDNLLKYVYNELPPEEVADTEIAIMHSRSTGRLVNELQQLKENINQAGLEPAVSSIANILEYSRNYDNIQTTV